MSKRKVYHVTHRPDGNWQARLRGAQRASSVEDTKAAAVDDAVRMARAASLGQVVIHKTDGAIQTEHTYGSDPRRYKG